MRHKCKTGRPIDEEIEAETDAAAVQKLKDNNKLCKPCLAKGTKSQVTFN